MITSRVRIKAPPALSCGEGQLHAVRSGFVETLFVQHSLEELGHDVRAEVRRETAKSAALWSSPLDSGR